MLVNQKTNEDIWESYAGKTINAKNDVFEMMNLARASERKRIRDECKEKRFEVELPDSDGWVKVVNPEDIDMWKD